jgi:hypothetical protein
MCHRHLGRRLFNDALSSPARTKRLLRRLAEYSSPSLPTVIFSHIFAPFLTARVHRYFQPLRDGLEVLNPSLGLYKYAHYCT